MDHALSCRPVWTLNVPPADPVLPCSSVSHRGAEQGSVYMPQESASQLLPGNNAILIETCFSNCIGFLDQAARKGVAE